VERLLEKKLREDDERGASLSSRRRRISGVSEREVVLCRGGAEIRGGRDRGGWSLCGAGTALVAAACGRNGSLVGRGLIAATGRRLVASRRGGGAIAALAVATLRGNGGGRIYFSIAAAEELDVVCNYLGHVFLLALLVVVLAGADVALYINLAALADEALSEVCELAPQDEVVPLGVLAELAVAVAETVCGCEGECGYFGALAALGGSLVEVTYFRVSSNVTDKKDFV
jgi:hypothetical protein